MKKLLILTLLVNALFSNELEVISSKVKFEINKKVYELEKGKKLELQEGDIVKFLEGNGKLIINKKTQLSKKTDSFQIPVSRGFFSNLSKKIKEGIVIAYLDSSESSKSGVSTKGDSLANTKGELFIKKENKEFVIFSEEFSPHPISISLKDENGKVIDSFVNEEADITFYKIDTKLLKTAYSLEVLSGLDEVLLDKKIVKE